MAKAPDTVGPETVGIEEYRFTDDGHVPNNPSLPLHRLSRRARKRVPMPPPIAKRCSPATAGAAAWRNGIYAHHHYHSTAHEVLGIVAGSVRVRLGGERGTTVELRAGDVVVIPAGVAHKNEGASPNLAGRRRLSRRQEPGHVPARRARARARPAQHPGGGAAGLRPGLRQARAAAGAVVGRRSAADDLLGGAATGSGPV